MKRPRFIAGAVCPACGAMDRLQLLDDDEHRSRRCVSCGHEDSLAAAASHEPRSRLDGALKKPADTEVVRTVRILEPPKDRDGDGPSSGADGTAGG